MDVAVRLRSLHERDVAGGEERHRLVEEIVLRDEVGVEDREELALGDGQRVVDVAGLRAVAAQAPQVAGPELRREVADLVRAAVVEHPGEVLAPHRDRRGDGAPDDVQGFAVHGDEHVDEWCHDADLHSVGQAR